MCSRTPVGLVEVCVAAPRRQQVARVRLGLCPAPRQRARRRRHHRLPPPLPLLAHLWLRTQLTECKDGRVHV